MQLKTFARRTVKHIVAGRPGKPIVIPGQNETVLFLVHRVSVEQDVYPSVTEPVVFHQYVSLDYTFGFTFIFAAVELENFVEAIEFKTTDGRVFHISVKQCPAFSVKVQRPDFIVFRAAVPGFPQTGIRVFIIDRPHE